MKSYRRAILSIVELFLVVTLLAACGSSGGSSDSGGSTPPISQPPVNQPPVAVADFVEEFDDEAGYISRWLRATWMQHSNQMGYEREAVAGGYLNMISTPQLESGCVQTRKEDYSYGRWEVRSKPSAVPGVLNSMFTVDWSGGDGVGSDGTKQEVDIEFLTHTFGQDSGEMHIAIHETGNSNHLNMDLELGFNPSVDFHIYAIEILPDRVNWYADDRLLHTYMYDGVVDIDARYMFMMNSWTASPATHNVNTVFWIQGPPTEGSLYLIDWVKFYPYPYE